MRRDKISGASPCQAIIARPSTQFRRLGATASQAGNSCPGYFPLAWPGEGQVPVWQRRTTGDIFLSFCDFATAQGEEEKEKERDETEEGNGEARGRQRRREREKATKLKLEKSMTGLDYGLLTVQNTPKLGILQKCECQATVSIISCSVTTHSLKLFWPETWNTRS